MKRSEIEQETLDRISEEVGPEVVQAALSGTLTPEQRAELQAAASEWSRYHSWATLSEEGYYQTGGVSPEVDEALECYEAAEALLSE